MQELFRRVPEVDQLVAMSAEEVGSVLLASIKERLSTEPREHFHPHTYANELEPFRLTGRPTYPDDRLQDAKVAVLEGMAWLERIGLLAPTLDASANTNGFRMLSRAAKAISDASGLQDFVVTRKFDGTLLHPKLRKSVVIELRKGDFAAAVFKAMRLLEEAVRAAGGYGPEMVGTDLMNKAFGNGGPLRSASAVQAEEDGLRSLFAGAMGAFKNPHSHRQLELDAEEAIEQVILASQLLKIVDARRKRP